MCRAEWQILRFGPLSVHGMNSVACQGHPSKTAFYLFHDAEFLLIWCFPVKVGLFFCCIHHRKMYEGGSKSKSILTGAGVIAIMHGLQNRIEDVTLKKKG